MAVLSPQVGRLGVFVQVWVARPLSPSLGASAVFSGKLHEMDHKVALATKGLQSSHCFIPQM